MTFAAAFWLSVFVFLLEHPEVGLTTWLSTALFVGLFLSSVLYHARTRIFVDGDSVTYQGVLKRTTLSFGDIQKVQVLPGIVTLYLVQAGRRNIAFTSFFRRHKELVALVREKADLA